MPAIILISVFYARFSVFILFGFLPAIILIYIRVRAPARPRARDFKKAEKLQLNGIDVDKNAVQRIESGKRFVTDVELAVLSRIFGVSCDELVRPSKE